MKLIDVRVLGATGVGYTSDVIAGIDWAIANRARYGIRVINLSLGHAVSEPSATDPLCQAVARAVQAGVVVVASAGNYGLTSTRCAGAWRHHVSRQFSAMPSPSARSTPPAPSRVATTRSRRTARGGRRAFDLAVKPDVVAPGTKLVSLEVAGLIPREASIPPGTSRAPARTRYFRLSGTSMSTAVVSGGVALLLDAKPSLTPGQVKVALQMGATFMPDGGLDRRRRGQRQFPAVA